LFFKYEFHSIPKVEIYELKFNLISLLHPIIFVTSEKNKKGKVKIVERRRFNYKYKTEM